MTRYRDAGVDLRVSDALKEELVREASTTWTAAVRDLGAGFAGVLEWPAGAPEPGSARHVPPLLAATLDGVGTKLHLARRAGRVADAAADLVYHGANDLLAHGARPVAFLDYVAQSRLEPDVIREVVRGIARACRETGAVLLGGETAEMPDTYLAGAVDVAGCMIGRVDPGALRDGRTVEPGDALLGLASAGLHTNGFSLARRILAESGVALASRLPGGSGETVADALLAPHRWYGPALEPELEARRVRALAHVTGGGIAANLARVLPEGSRAAIDPGFPRPAVFRWLCGAGRVPEDDARRAFNLGIGMVVVAARGEADRLAADLAARGETVWRLGEIRAGPRGVDWSR